MACDSITPISASVNHYLAFSLPGPSPLLSLTRELVIQFRSCWVVQDELMSLNYICRDLVPKKGLTAASHRVAMRFNWKIYVIAGY